MYICAFRVLSFFFIFAVYSVCVRVYGCVFMCVVGIVSTHVHVLCLCMREIKLLFVLALTNDASFLLMFARSTVVCVLLFGRISQLF